MLIPFVAIHTANLRQHNLYDVYSGFYECFEMGFQRYEDVLEQAGCWSPQLNSVSFQDVYLDKGIPFRQSVLALSETAMEPSEEAP